MLHAPENDFLEIKFKALLLRLNNIASLPTSADACLGRRYVQIDQLHDELLDMMHS